MTSLCVEHRAFARPSGASAPHFWSASRKPALTGSPRHAVLLQPRPCHRLFAASAKIIGKPIHAVRTNQTFPQWPHLICRTRRRRFPQPSTLPGVPSDPRPQPIEIFQCFQSVGCGRYPEKSSRMTYTERQLTYASHIPPSRHTSPMISHVCEQHDRGRT